ncbi:tail tube protein [Rhodobacter phage RcSimone-Hastad]|nr:tail tube protein [Rhodobacter phage RcSimone-Hastad]
MPIVVPSNGTGLAIAEEVIGTPGTLPGSPVWKPLEPNTYADFGGQTKLTPRNPITSTRQRKKGVVTDLDAAGGFNTDFVTESLTDVLQGFLFADWRKKTNLVPTAVSGTQYTVASGGAGFLTNSLLFGEGHGVAGNNGLKVVTASTATTISAAGLAVETPPATAKITRVGHQGASADLTMTVSSGVATLGSTALNFTTLGLIPGEWIWVGGDSAASQFATAANNGFYRIKTIAANAIVFDRQPSTSVTDAGTGKTIQLFFGHVLKNESSAALQKLRTYHLERQLTSSQFEYIKGAAPNTMVINIKKADKITFDVSFVGLTTERTAAAKSGTRETLPVQAAFNSSSDFTRLRFSDDTTAASLASYVDEVKLTIDNGIDPVKAVAALGGIDISYGDFMVSGTINAFFTTYAAVDAVMNNDDCAIDFALVTRSGDQRLPVGWLFDVPLMALGDGRLKVEKDKPIMLPVSYDAAAHGTLDHTLLVMDFGYLPILAL